MDTNPAKPKPVVLFVVQTSASGPVGELRRGQVAEEGAAILKTHGHLFAPLKITYKA